MAWVLLVAPRYRTSTSVSFPRPLIRSGSVLFLAIGKALPRIGGSVAVAYQAIGRTLHKRWLRIRGAVWGELLCMVVISRLSLLRHSIAQLRLFLILTASFSPTLHRSDIFSRSRPAGAGFSISLLLRTKPALVHYTRGSGPTGRKRLIRLCVIFQISLKVSMLCVCVSCNASCNPVVIHSLTAIMRLKFVCVCENF